MVETDTQDRPVFVVRLRGGIGDGTYRLALGHVPPGLTVERAGQSQPYEYAGAEDQVEHSNVYDAGSKRSGRVSRVAAVYHIFCPVTV